MTKLRWAKPSIEEQRKIEKMMFKTNVKVCGVCWKEDDEDTNGEQILWIQCDSCGLWSHISCCDSTIENENFLCKSCTVTF